MGAALDLEDETRKERHAKELVASSGEKVASMRHDIASIKAKADAAAHKVEARKTDLQQLQQAEAKIRAGTMGKVSHIKTKIAQAEAKKASAEEAIKQLNANIAETQEDAKSRKQNIAKLNSQTSAKEKELNDLKKKVSVLKAFLTGPILGTG